MSKSHIGKTIYVAAALPATNTAAGFEALTWVKVNGVQTIGSLGVTHANIDVPDLQTGFVAGVKGAGSGNDVPMTFRTVASDAGQEDIIDLANGPGDDGFCSIKVVKGSGAAQAPVTGDPVEYAQGYAHSYATNEASDTSFEGFSVSFRQNDYTVVDVEPA